ncbi:MAG: RsmD family RNA methyltransferase [Chloroflexi bacterium]|nr:RsmD family RNA methyltransferase [Chloroflexota bacterium]
MAKRSKQRKSSGRSENSRLIGRHIDLDISDMAHGGRGLGWHHNKPVFVPYTLPGESITAEITVERKNVLFARGLRLKAASADRAAPRCPHFGPGLCWGCHWQHIDYAAQLLLKRDVLADQLSRQGRLPDAMIESALRPVRPASARWEYNHSISLSRDEVGDWGMRRDGGGIEVLGECHITDPEILDLLTQLELDFATARRLTIRRGSDGRMMLVLHVDKEEAPELQTDLPLSVNLVLPDREPISLIGEAQSRFEIAGREFRVTAGAYIRPSVGGIQQLLEEVLRALDLQREETVLDLYAGVGIYSAFMARDAALVTLVESYPPAVTDADVNLSDLENVDVVEGQVETVLADIVAAEAQYDVALVDPPSAGLSADTIAWLERLEVRRLVYVSGDPGSLARDCRQLASAGFQLREIQPIDLAPHTHYITAVARFER